MNFIIGLFFNPSVPSASCSGGKKNPRIRPMICRRIRGSFADSIGNGQFSSHRSASMAARAPIPAAVIAWRYRLSAQSPAPNTPSTDVYDVFD